MSKLIVCFDTTTLSHYLWCGPNNSENHKRATKLVEELHENGKSLYIPTLALAELLCKFEDPDERKELFKQLEGLFKFVDFDIRSAFESSAIFKKNRNLMSTNETGEKYVRNHFKVDCQIAGTVKSINASCLYSEDPHMTALSSGLFKTIKLEEFSYQEPLIDLS